MFKRVQGTRDILPDQAALWQSLELKSRRVFSLFNFHEIRPPLIEDAGLFNRSLGQSSEIVQKQMFLIKKEEDTYALRPEGTASIVRAYVENNLDKSSPFQKLYYIGPMFRMERPQKGRFRQFHHIGCEALGSLSPELDVEVISLAINLLEEYSISGYTLKLNSLGCRQDKDSLSRRIRDELKGELANLCEDCRMRYERNALRIMDCKNDPCRELLRRLKLGENYLCQECSDNFQQVRDGLDALKIAYVVDPFLVRGLDYYNRTVFEISHTQLGSQQDALGAGGRYDGLISELGGQSQGAVGFAFGVERLLLVLPAETAGEKSCLVYLIPLGEEARKKSPVILNDLRRAGIESDTDYEGRSLKACMRRANDLAARFAVIVGEDELKSNSVMLKDMQESKQELVPLAGLIEKIKAVSVTVKK